MTAEYLRETARMMREVAEAVDGWYSAPAWATTAPFNLPIDQSDAAHIAAWHPAVALAVADWLGFAAEAHLSVMPGNYPFYLQALAVAQAWRGNT